MNLSKNYNQKRILYIVADPSMGGSSRSLVQLIIELRENYNVKPIILIPYAKHIKKIKLEEKCKELNIQCYVLRYFPFKGKGKCKQFIKTIINYFIFYPIILFKLRSLHVDLIHTNNSIIDIGVFLSFFKKVKHVWHLREFGDLDFGLYSAFGKKFDSFIYSFGDIFIAISQSIKATFSNIIPENKIKLIYNGIIPQVEDLDSKHSNTIIEFVMVGSIQKTKNQLEALQALTIIKKRGYKANLNFIGATEEEYYLELQKYIKENSLENDVKFWGECDNVPQILSNMDVGLMLSQNEAFGRVTVEYMLQNIFVIATNRGANPEIIKDGETGFLYQIGNINELADKMCFCIENRQTMKEVSFKGKSIAKEKFVSTINTKNIYSIYNKIIESKN